MLTLGRGNGKMLLRVRIRTGEVMQSENQKIWSEACRSSSSLAAQPVEVGKDARSLVRRCIIAHASKFFIRLALAEVDESLSAVLRCKWQAQGIIGASFTVFRCAVTRSQACELL